MASSLKEFEAFVDKMQAVENEFLSWLNSFLLLEGARALKLIKKGTPVDTGLLRRSWSINSVTRAGNSLEVWIVNPVHYASHVEFGWRRGAASYGGAHMVEVSLTKIREALPSRFDKQFTEWLEGKLG